MSVTLPFSKRTTTAVTLFTCLFIASPQGAQQIDTATVAQISALQQEYATIFHTYRQVRHQDVANQASKLDVYILAAQTVIEQLQTTLNGMTQPNPPEYDELLLTHMQLVVDAAAVTMANVVAAPDDGE
jgi:hypothetical protein